MNAIFDSISPARASAFVAANGLLGFEARPVPGSRPDRPAWAVVEHRADAMGRSEIEHPAGDQLEACQTARRWAEALGLEVLAVGQARLALAGAAAALRGKGVAL